MSLPPGEAKCHQRLLEGWTQPCSHLVRASRRGMSIIAACLADSLAIADQANTRPMSATNNGWIRPEVTAARPEDSQREVREVPGARAGGGQGGGEWSSSSG